MYGGCILVKGLPFSNRQFFPFSLKTRYNLIGIAVPVVGNAGHVTLLPIYVIVTTNTSIAAKNGADASVASAH